MPSPFPGMDPYIEAPKIWIDFHNGLADEIRATLNRRIRPNYFASLTPYVTYEAVEVTYRHTEKIRPDVGIWKMHDTPGKTPARNLPTEGGVAVLEREDPSPIIATLQRFPSPMPIENTVIRELPIELFSVDIRSTDDEETLVTSIEILSPVNKQRTHVAHKDYLRKRRELLRSATHLIEIDLLRGGLRPPFSNPLPATPYYISLSRFQQRPMVLVWPIPLQASLPVIPVPLLEPDADVMLDMGEMVASVYERGGYDMRINYHQPVPPPALSPADQLWVESMVAGEG